MPTTTARHSDGPTHGQTNRPKQNGQKARRKAPGENARQAQPQPSRETHATGEARGPPRHARERSRAANTPARRRRSRARDPPDRLFDVTDADSRAGA